MIVDTIRDPLVFLLRTNLLLLVIGCFMEALAARLILILILILVLAAARYGSNPVQFGVMVVLNLIIGAITPPVGVVLFMVTRIADISRPWRGPFCPGWCRCSSCSPPSHCGRR